MPDIEHGESTPFLQRPGVRTAGGVLGVTALVGGGAAIGINAIYDYYHDQGLRLCGVANLEGVGAPDDELQRAIDGFGKVGIAHVRVVDNARERDDVADTDDVETTLNTMADCTHADGTPYVVVYAADRPRLGDIQWEDVPNLTGEESDAIRNSLKARLANDTPIQTVVAAAVQDLTDASSSPIPPRGDPFEGLGRTAEDVGDKLAQAWDWTGEKIADAWNATTKEISDIDVDVDISLPEVAGAGGIILSAGAVYEGFMITRRRRALNDLIKSHLDAMPDPKEVAEEIAYLEGIMTAYNTFFLDLPFSEQLTVSSKQAAGREVLDEFANLRNRITAQTARLRSVRFDVTDDLQSVNSGVYAHLRPSLRAVRKKAKQLSKLENGKLTDAASLRASLEAEVDQCFEDLDALSAYRDTARSSIEQHPNLTITARAEVSRLVNLASGAEEAGHNFTAALLYKKAIKTVEDPKSYKK